MVSYPGTWLIDHVVLLFWQFITSSIFNTKTFYLFHSISKSYQKLLLCELYDPGIPGNNLSIAFEAYCAFFGSFGASNICQLVRSPSLRNVLNGIQRQSKEYQPTGSQTDEKCIDLRKFFVSEYPRFNLRFNWSNSKFCSNSLSSI